VPLYLSGFKYLSHSPDRTQGYSDLRQLRRFHRQNDLFVDFRFETPISQAIEFTLVPFDGQMYRVPLKSTSLGKHARAPASVPTRHLLVLPLPARRGASNQPNTQLASDRDYRAGFFGAFGCLVAGGGNSSTHFINALGLMPKTWQSRKYVVRVGLFRLFSS
jgi:hypothetical protein